jgi:hypothetical protein
LQLLAAVLCLCSSSLACGGDDAPPTTPLPRIDAGEPDSGAGTRDSGQNPPGKQDAGHKPTDSGNPFPKDSGQDSGPTTAPDAGGEVPYTPGPAPDEWTCTDALWNDGYCDCGCGVADSDCVGQSCTELGCVAQGCDACYTAERAWKPCEVPPDPSTWSCTMAEQTDLLCDCGCSVADDACRGSGCSEAGCWRGACDLRHGSDGSTLSPSRPPPSWTCPSAAWGGGNGCDCGCGAADPDCQSAFFCNAPLCNATECAICHDNTGRTVPCDNSLLDWKCDAQRFGSGDGCDCGCGVPDPDCGAGNGCSDHGCRADACKRCSDLSLSEDRLVGCASSAQWTCELSHYGTQDGCDCGCGIADPDCGSGNGCTDSACQSDKCDYCHQGSSDGPADYQICNGWTCGNTDDPAWKEDKCDCGCGKPDPYCRLTDRVSCNESGCQTATCQFCNTSGSARAECDGDAWSSEGTCAQRNYGLDGKCDCGCGAIDPDCAQDEGCSTPYCAAKGCEVCHGSGSQLATCYEWTCPAAAYGDGKCDCGCGAPDPDCSGLGCSEPGCRGQADACKPDGCHDPFGRTVPCP